MKTPTEQPNPPDNNKNVKNGKNGKKDIPPSATSLRNYFILKNQEATGDYLTIPSSLRSWDNTFRLMLNHNKFPEPLIRNVIDFAAGELKNYLDGVQYAFRVESPDSLRQKFDKLKAKMANRAKGGQDDGAPKKSLHERMMEAEGENTDDVELQKGPDGEYT